MSSAGQVYGDDGDDRISCRCTLFGWNGSTTLWRFEGGSGDDIYSFGYWINIPSTPTIRSMVPGPGTDTLEMPASLGFTTFVRLADCPLCVERVFGTADEDRITGDDEAQEISGRGGPDKIDGGGGADVLAGEDGDDTIQAQDGAIDTVTCGSGTDTVTADLLDDVSLDCETVSRAGAPPDTTKPSCGELVVRRNPGGHDEGDVTVSDAGGIKSIENFRVINGTASIPAFTPGTTSVTVTAIKTKQGKPTFFEFDVTDQGGNRVHCV